MGTCPHCGQMIIGLHTDIMTSQGIGDAPYAIQVLLISCARSDCGKVLGVLHPLQPERPRR